MMNAFSNSPGSPYRGALSLFAVSMPHGCGRGARGTLALQIGLRYTHLRGIITDLPPLCEIANKWIDAYELSDRFTAVPADLFEGAYPDGADAPGPHFARLKRQ